MLNLYKFTPFISFFGFCIYSWSPLSLVSKQKWSFSTPLNGNRGRVKAELLCFVAVFYFDWLQLTKELPHYWRIHSWKQGFFPELFLARSSHPGFDVRGRAYGSMGFKDTVTPLLLSGIIVLPGRCRRGWGYQLHCPNGEGGGGASPTS